MALTYSEYLQVDRLLDLQVPQSDPAEHDEYLFIIIHQTYELWFKQLLLEFERINHCLSANELYEVIHTFKRARTIMKTLVEQIDILETMTPMSFTSFRDRLDTASGFQSYQFREFEFLLGYKRPEMIQYHPEGSEGHKRLMRRLEERSVIDHFYDFLEARGMTIPEELRSKDVKAPTQASDALQDQLYDMYRTQEDVAILFELMTDFDEGMQEWRYRHIKLVERTIGAKHGTGGSLGVEFLKKSLYLQVFPDLWAIRHRL